YKKPRERREISTECAKLDTSIVIARAVWQQSANAIDVDIIERLLVAAGAAAVGYGLVEGCEIFERWCLAFRGRVAQVLVAPVMGRLPCRFVRLPQPLAEPLAHQRMGIQRVGSCRVGRRQQP